VSNVRINVFFKLKKFRPKMKKGLKSYAILILVIIELSKVCVFFQLLMFNIGVNNAEVGVRKEKMLGVCKSI